MRKKNPTKNTKKCISLFSSAGIGELGIKANGIEIVVSNEIIENRHDLYQLNFPNTKCFTGDIWEQKNKIIKYYKDNFDEELFMLHATPPCQGMSTNGAGMLLNKFRKGLRPQLDPRNRLIIPTIEIILKLKPKWVLLENVTNMRNTLIENEKGEIQNILKYIENKLSKLYVGGFEVLNSAEFGVPTIRKRLISVFSRTEKGKKYLKNEKKLILDEEKLPREKWVTLKDAIGNIPKLDGKEGKNKNLKFNPFHYVPILNEKKYWWIKNTPEGETAFSNQCENLKCKSSSNRKHGTALINGVHQSNKDTPIYCKSCKKLLPRPTIIDKKTGKLRLIKGFDTAYKRMEWNKPAPTLTQNFQFEASDNKIHPSQNRVLSIYEALILQGTSNYEYSFLYKNEIAPKSQMQEVIGESVPPKLIDIVCKKILNVESGAIKSKQLLLFEKS